MKTGLQFVLPEGDIEVLSETGLTDMTFVPEVETHEVDTVVVFITAVEQGRLSIGTTIEVMEPLQTSREVAPTDIDHVLQGCTVVTCKETEEELVAGRHRPIDLRIDIIEIKRVVLEVVAEFEKGIEISAAGSDEE